jgi:hypothetical protein
MPRPVLKVATPRLPSIGPRSERTNTRGAQWAVRFKAASLLSAAADLCGLMNMTQVVRSRRDEGDRS